LSFVLDLCGNARCGHFDELSLPIASFELQNTLPSL
jgi:hypothetical protein